MLKTTVKSDKRDQQSGVTHPPGLLRFHPLGPEPTMSYFSLIQERVSLGRSEECEIQVDDQEASRVHAQLDRSEQYWQVVDCNSTNGVYLNGQQITTHPLAGGELIRIGGTFFRFFRRGLAPSSRVFPLKAGPIVAGPVFDDFWEILDRAAGSDLSVLVHGETGTGKELIASYLHEGGRRKGGPFVPVNCAAIPRDLFESELFGHVKGAFTGATADKLGLLRQASGGTLFFDEVGELPLQMQVKLLRVLQERKIQPVGSVVETVVDVRVVAATNKDLFEEVQTKRFREDLYYRLNVIQLEVPPLRERSEDIPLLIQHFLGRFSQEQDKRIEGVSPRAMEVLLNYSYPGNVRELENIIERAVTLELDTLISTEVLPTPMMRKEQFLRLASDLELPEEGLELEQMVENLERSLLLQAIERSQGNRTEAAKLLGISFRSIRYRLDKYGISADES